MGEPILSFLKVWCYQVGSTPNFNFLFWGALIRGYVLIWLSLTPPPPSREVHSVCSWDEKSSVKIHKALEQEITLFISDAQKVNELCITQLINFNFLAVFGSVC